MIEYKSKNFLDLVPLQGSEKYQPWLNPVITQNTLLLSNLNWCNFPQLFKSNVCFHSILDKIIYEFIHFTDKKELHNDGLFNHSKYILKNVNYLYKLFHLA